jgi:hypothetical protein
MERIICIIALYQTAEVLWAKNLQNKTKIEAFVGTEQ